MSLSMPAVIATAWQTIVGSTLDLLSSLSLGSAPSSPSLAAILTVWQNIESFLALEKTVAVAVAGACRALNETIVDANTRRVRVSHLESIRVRPERYKDLLPTALSRINFSALRRFRYPPRANGRDLEEHRKLAHCAIWEVPIAVETDEIIGTCFESFVAQLVPAKSLEHHHFDAARIILERHSGPLLHQTTYGALMHPEPRGPATPRGEDESSWSARIAALERMMGAFGRALQGCSSLTQLSVMNRGNEGYRAGRRPCHSAALARALIPTIRTRQLQSLNAFIQGQGRQLTNSRATHTSDDNAIIDFFDAVLSAKYLSSLTIEMDHADSLAKAADDQLNKEGV